ncbi:PrsW family intramembrane metalloprotease [Candidatus Peregrinibacteria bacterium]|nr:PrsW family intramembrane metalloprotease [Candidatus Peregrinibacteria bacterium]
MDRIIIIMFEYASTRIILALLMAIVPAVLWGLYFFKKQPQTRNLVIKLFIAGGVSVAPLLLYKYLWQFFPWINAFTYANNYSDDMIGFANVTLLPLSVLLTFMIVGIIEEIAKYAAVKNIHHKHACSITDCMEYFIIVAIGFAFVENIIYFTNIMQVRGVEEVMLPFIFRSLFSSFAHIMFSGILGYYYGLAHFAAPVLQEEWNQKDWTTIRTIAKTIGIKKEILFHHEKIIQGLLTAIGLHAIFNILLEMNWTFLIVPFLTAGFIVLTMLFDNKHVDKNYYCIED